MARKVLIDAKGKRFDPKKWSLDSDTGEYHQVTYRSSRGNLIDARSYSERRTVALIKSRDIKVPIGVCVLMWAVAYAIYNYFGTYDFWDPFQIPIMTVLGFFLAAYLTVVALFRIHEVEKAWEEVGPAPFAPRGREDVEEQKVHGRGGWLEDDQLDKALKGDQNNEHEAASGRGGKRIKPQQFDD